MKMKILLLSLCLSVAPAWAADAGGTAPAEKTSTQAAAPAAQPGQKAPEKAKKKKTKKKKAKAAKSEAGEGTTSSCPKSCVMMNCPPPSGTYQLCCPVAPYNQTCP